MTDDNIIQFPGKRTDIYSGPGSGDYTEAPVKPEEVVTDELKLTPDQEKAISTILSGTSFVCIGILPTPDGADFITACGGEPADLRNAQEHLPGVILRLFERKGIL
jgi:hypothetical protein